MNKPIKIIFYTLFLTTAMNFVNAQQNGGEHMLSDQQQGLVKIAAWTAKGNLKNLETSLHEGLQAGLSVHQIKESLIHLYAYCGFPRSLRGLQTFMKVLDERRSRGISDLQGEETTAIDPKGSKYERGKAILSQLTNTVQQGPLTGYAAFAPAIDTFLKEHLFADLFERDALTYAQRELMTVTVLSTIGGVEPMLKSHFSICLNVGITKQQLIHFVTLIESTLGKREAISANNVLVEVLNISSDPPSILKNYVPSSVSVFPLGEKINNANFSGTAYLKTLMEPDSLNPTAVGSVTFETGARTKWHLHPGGQILLALEGVGFYQEKGQPKRILRKGEVVKCPPNTPHWHGASEDSSFVQIAITNNYNGPTLWLEQVSDIEYKK